MLTPTVAGVFTPANRKYIGSKVRLLGFLSAHIEATVGDFHTFADPFAGTGVVAHHYARQGKTVLANDHLYSNYLGLRTFLGPEAGGVASERLPGFIDELNQLAPVPGYCTANFGGTYFTDENAGRIDAVRVRLEQWRTAGEITFYEFAALLTALLYAGDKVANTCGQYDAFLKHLGKAAYGADGTHLVDASAYKRLELLVPDLHLVQPGNRTWCRDANALAGRLAVDVLYLDPPYNSRQYVDNYHVLENIAQWRRPPLRGVTRKFERRHLKSRYANVRAAATALDDLIARARARHIFLSYNSEGLLSQEQLVALLAAHGQVTVFAADYGVFGNGAGKSRKRRVTERLYHCRKGIRS